jgi:hypothetical protein
MSPPHRTLPPRINHTTTTRHKTRRTLENTHVRLVPGEPYTAAKRWGGSDGAAPKSRLTTVRSPPSMPENW